MGSITSSETVDQSTYKSSSRAVAPVEAVNENGRDDHSPSHSRSLLEATDDEPLASSHSTTPRASPRNSANLPPQSPQAKGSVNVAYVHERKHVQQLTVNGQPTGATVTIVNGVDKISSNGSLSPTSQNYVEDDLSVPSLGVSLAWLIEFKQKHDGLLTAHRAHGRFALILSFPTSLATAPDISGTYAPTGEDTSYQRTGAKEVLFLNYSYLESEWRIQTSHQQGKDCLARCGKKELHEDAVWQVKSGTDWVEARPEVLIQGTTKHVVKSLLSPETAPARQSYVQLLQAQQATRRHVQRANCYVIHAWRSQFAELVDALAANFPPADHSRKFLWIDAFSVNPYEKRGPRATYITDVRALIGSIGHSLLVLSPWPTPLVFTRSWCFWEVLSSDLDSVKIDICLSPTDFKEFQDNLSNNFYKIRTLLQNISATGSTASDPEDRKILDELISATRPGVVEGGIEDLNKLATTVVTQWVLRKALWALKDRNGTEDEQTFQLENAVGALFNDLGRLEEAESYLRRALAGHEALYGETHANTLALVSNLAVLTQNQGKHAEAELLHRRALMTRETSLGPMHVDTLISVASLAILQKEQGKIKEAEALFRRALAGQEKILGENHRDTIKSMTSLAAILQDQPSKLSEAEALFNRALSALEASQGKEHPLTIHALADLANLVYRQGRLSEAESLYRKVLQLREAVLGPQHADTLSSVNNLAVLLRDQHKVEEAEPLYRRALQAREASLGPTHPNTLTSLNNLAVLLYAQKKVEEAEPLFRRALQAQEKALGEEHPQTLSCVSNLAVLLAGQGKLDEAEALYRRALDARQKSLGKTHPVVLSLVNNLAALLQDQAKYSDAEPFMRRGVEGLEATLGPTHPDTLNSIYGLAELLRKQGRIPEAIPLFLRELEGCEINMGFMHADTQGSVRSLATLLESQGQKAEADALRAGGSKAYHQLLSGK